MATNELRYDDYLGWLKQNGYIIKLQGNEYVTHKGLLGLATKYGGLKKIDTELIAYDIQGSWAIVRAVVEGERGQYSGIGDGTPSNLKKVVSSAFIRMAETRAVNRALRSYLAVGVTSLEELPEMDDKKAKSEKSKEQDQADRMSELNEVCGSGHNVGDVLSLMMELKGQDFDLYNIPAGDFKALKLFISTGTINKNQKYLEIKEKVKK